MSEISKKKTAVEPLNADPSTLSFDELVRMFSDLMIAQLDASIARKAKIERRKRAHKTDAKQS